MTKRKRNTTTGEEIMNSSDKKLESIVIEYLMFFIMTKMRSCILNSTWARRTVLHGKATRSAANNVPIAISCTVCDYVTTTITITTAVIMFLITVTPIIISWYIRTHATLCDDWMKSPSRAALSPFCFSTFSAFRTTRCRNYRIHWSNLEERFIRTYN